MPVLNEGMHRGEFIATEARGTRSRDLITLAAAQVLAAGTVLGKVTASNQYVAVNPAAADGSQTAAAVLYDNVDTTAGAKSAVAVVREAELNASEIGYPAGATAAQIAAINAQLAAQQVLVRPAV